MAEELSQVQATRIVVEEFEGRIRPTKYKFYVVNGKVATINLVDGRNGDCPCYWICSPVHSMRSDRTTSYPYF